MRLEAGALATTDNVVFTFTPAASVENERRYKVAVAGALAADGRTLTPYEMTTGSLTHELAVDAKVLYMVNATSGDLGGVAGAGNLCSTKPTRPAGVVAAKAMIAATTRTACSVARAVIVSGVAVSAITVATSRPSRRG